MNEHTTARICRRCVMDTSDPEISFDENGFCNHCRAVAGKLNREPFCLTSGQKWATLQAIVETIKKAGRRKKYDCIIGLSGGVDSSYVALKVKEMGLRPLAVHLDNGWDSELSVKNIENICSKLNIDLFTYVIDWEEFKDLQLAFLKSSTPDSEIPSDHAIFSILYTAAVRNRVNYIVTGFNLMTESIMPRAWSQGHWDWTYIRTIQKKFGTRPLKTFPHRSYWSYIAGKLLPRRRWINLLDYLDYRRDEAKALIQTRLGWRDYGRKHGESVYTRFFQEYILPVKFGFDKRKGHYSSLIMSEQMTREEALRLLRLPLYDSQKAIDNDKQYVGNKLDLSPAEFDAIMNLPPKSYWDYNNFQRKWYYRLFRGAYYALRKGPP